MIRITVITPEMIEAAAIALRDCTGNNGRGKSWHKLPDNIKAMYRAEALAVLKAALDWRARDVA
jgi:hypothetical protein